MSQQPPERTPEQIEAGLDGIGALVNLHHAITGEDCPRHLAVGMATCAVSSLRSERNSLVTKNERLTAELQALADRLNTPIAELRDVAAVELANTQLRAAVEAAQRWIKEFRAFRPTTELGDNVLDQLRKALAPEANE